MPRTRLITRGDDAGSSLSANRAILESAQAGTLRNISLMAPGPHFEDAAKVLCGLTDVEFGLHVTLNSEWDAPRWGPIAPRETVSSLLDADGNFTRTPNILAERDPDADEMLREVEAQLQRARALGFSISYLDEHMGVGWVPGLGTRLRALCRSEGLRYAGTVRGLPRLENPLPDLLDDLSARLQAAPPGDYVYVTHPAFDDAEMQPLFHDGLARGQIARERDADRGLWCNARLPKVLCDADAQVARYSDVLGV